jgi:hypothetical protein
MDLSSFGWSHAISVAAFIASLISLYFTKVNWIQSNRPVVTAFVTEHHSGNAAATFNLVLANTGTRPAVRVQLVASPEAIKSLLEPDASDKHAGMIQQVFGPKSEVALLRNGENLTTSFGAFTPGAADGKWLNYGAEANIEIRYDDLDGRSYVSKQPIKIYARDGFGGGTWED